MVRAEGGIAVPTIVIQGYTFRFYSSDRFEPAHIHVLRDGNVAKVWLDPVRLEYNRGYNRTEVSRILALTTGHRARLLGAWNEYFSR